LISTPCLAQCLCPEGAISMEKNEYEYSDSSYGMNYHVIEYAITNTSKDYYYTWIDYSNTMDYSKSELIKRYFFSYHGDFNLMSLLKDNCIILDFKPEVGKSFLKRINPHDTFRYIVINSKNVVYEDHIIIISLSDLGQWADTPFNEGIIYDADYIVLYDQ